MGSCRVVAGSSPGAAGAGLWTTVQDLGRPGLSPLGVPAGGAADSISLRTGNALVGNKPDSAPGEAALEMTFVGASLEFETNATVALAGAFAAARIERRSGESEPAACWESLALRAGDRLICGPIAGGARGYLCVRGGVRVPRVLGSASTYLAGGTGFGGLGGRVLRPGDRVEFASAPGEGPSRRIAPEDVEWVQSCVLRRTIRAVDGAHAGAFDAGTIDVFWGATFETQSRSDRVGVRLAPDDAAIPSPGSGRMSSEGMPHGAAQIPAAGGGEAIVLGPDHPTTGGYPVIAAVIAADLSALGQLRPGERVRFERVKRDEARRLWREQEDRLRRIIG